MELKQMPNVAVTLDTKEELDEYLKICEAGGWVTAAGARPVTFSTLVVESRCQSSWTISAFSPMWHNIAESGRTFITLTEFKKEQGIMKYKEGDTLENDRDQTFTVEGIIGRVYVGIDDDDEAITFSESELGDYALKTDEPEITELTLEDVAKLKGIPVEQLRIKD